jgi:hypothetical protein
MPLLQEDPIVVLNLGEINRDLKALGPAIYKAAKIGMELGAEPIRLDAERLAQSEISGMKRAKKKPPPWSIQRKGSTVHEVYIAPRERGLKSRTDQSRRRPNFVHVMFGKSYNPAFEKGRTTVFRYVDNWLGSVTREF